MNHYIELLKRLDCAKMAEHSVINHHVEGMNYICLHRTNELTVKIYMMEKPTNLNSSYLVHPHSHRYGFDSTVLHGSLAHIRFYKSEGKLYRKWSEFQYRPESRKLEYNEECAFYCSLQWHYPGDSYYVDSNEIHTLALNEEHPVVIGLMQYRDERLSSELYLPPGMLEPVFPRSRKPTASELNSMRERALELIKV